MPARISASPSGPGRANATRQRRADFAAPEVTRSADSEYPYRQNSDFWYFTGFNEPEAVLVLIKSDDTHNHSVLFNRVRDLTAEIWFGRRLGRCRARETGC
ncbi:hypothetical protein DMI60_19075 [Escherichia coli]|nr:hypothetical protein [Escherichia coli]